MIASCTAAGVRVSSRRQYRSERHRLASGTSPARPAFMRPVCDTLKANVPEIMREWEGITHEEPWTSLPKTYRVRIDSAITLATRATLVGYHRAEYESQGPWDNVVDRLVEDAPLFKLAQADETVEPSAAV